MECLGPQCAEMLLEWLKARTAGSSGGESPAGAVPKQGLLWTASPYREEAASIATPGELAAPSSTWSTPYSGAIITR